MSKEILETDDPNGKPEHYYVCLKCAREGEDVFVEAGEADKEYPDWNKAWREELKKRYAKRPMKVDYLATLVASVRATRENQEIGC